MNPETDKSNPSLSKFPNAEQANVSSASLPSAFSLFTPSVNAIKLNLVAFLIVIALPSILSLIGEGPGLMNPQSANPNPFAMESGNSLAIFGVIGSILALIFGPGSVILMLKSVRKETIDYGTAIREGLTYFWRFLGLGILTIILLAGSFLLLIVPFFFVLPRIILASYYLIDKNMGIIDSLKASAADYKTHKGVWGVLGVYVLFALTSVIPFVGTIISAVLLFLYTSASAIRYEQRKLLIDGKKPVTPIESSPATA